MCVLVGYTAGLLSRPVSRTDDDADGRVDSTSHYDSTYTNERYVSSIVRTTDSDMDGVPNYGKLNGLYIHPRTWRTRLPVSFSSNSLEQSPPITKRLPVR